LEVQTQASKELHARLRSQPYFDKEGKLHIGKLVLAISIAGIIATAAGVVWRYAWIEEDQTPSLLGSDNWDPGLTDFDHVLGSSTAPITIVEYASFTCPHCVHFITDVMPQVQERFIKPGIARYIFRDFPLDGLALRASMITHCAPRQGYYTLVSALFATQQQWVTAKEPLQALARSPVIKLAGIDEEEFNVCMNDQILADRIITVRQEAVDRWKVDSTPTFLVNGEKFFKLQSIDDLASIIERYSTGYRGETLQSK
jgi:hypothetical protein